MVTFSEGRYYVYYSILLMSCSLCYLYSGFLHLWRFIVRNRDDNFRLSKYSEDKFFEKIQLIASLPYRYFFSFGFIVVEIKNCENKYKPKVYNRAYELILSNTRRYYLCANIIKRIVLFIPYLDSTFCTQDPQKDLERIQNLLRTDDQLKEYEFNIKSAYGKFEKKEIDSIGPYPKEHLQNLEVILKSKYNEAVEK